MTSPGLFGTPFPPSAPRSITSVLLVEPTLGFDVSHSALALANGATPNSDNFVMRDGRLESRPMLSLLTDAANDPRPVDVRVLGGAEVVAVDSTRYLLLGGFGAPWGGNLAWLRSQADVWQSASYTTANGVNTPPTATNDNYWDWTQMFDDASSENLAIAGTHSRQGLYCWAPGSAAYSTLTGSPGARCVAAFNNYLLAANIADGGATYVQRVQWSDRGSASSWTGGLSGFEDLLNAKGGVNRMVAMDRGVAVFFDDEVWAATPIEFPSTFQFDPLDRSVGCPYPLTAAMTPLGVMFMARNYQLYVLPKSGGVAQPIGQKLHRSIRDAIVSPTRAWGVFDAVRNQYQLYYAASGVSGNVPHNAAFLQLDTGAWAPQSFASGPTAYLSLTYGFGASLLQSRATSWDDSPGVWSDGTYVATSWDDMLGLGNERQTVVLASSRGTLYQPNSTITRDAVTQVVTRFWESPSLGAEWPAAQKVITEIRADYRAPSASSLTVRALQGVTYSTGTALALPAASGVTQAVAYAQTPSRYAALRVEADSRDSSELHRFFVTMRVGGR